jgi:hypothetical protein
VVPGDLLLVQPGEIVPVDGHLERDVAVLGGRESTATMSRAHAEIARLIRRLGRVLDGHDPGPPDDAEVLEVRRLVYGLHAILRLHFAQEEEEYFSLLDEPTGSDRRSPMNVGRTDDTVGTHPGPSPLVKGCSAGRR